MFRRKDDEEEERKRQEKERAELSLNDRLYGPKKVTATGTDSGHHVRRTGRKAQINVRIRPKLRHMIDALMRRDQVPSLVVLFEMMLEAYQEKWGALREGDIPSDEEIIDMFLQEQDNRDAK